MTIRTILAHGHIFKNAGTTLDWALRRSFGSDFLDHREDHLMRNQGAAHLAELLVSRPALKAISSHHLCYPMPDIEGTKIVVLYMLRHPIERVLSVYEFERKQRSDTPGARHAKRMDLAEYVRWRLRPDVGATIRNYQVRYLAGLQKPGRVVSADDYLVAKGNLESARVGVVELFDQSLVEFEFALGEETPDLDLAYVPQNVNRNRAETQEKRIAELRTRLGGPLFDQLCEANALDLQLHEVSRSVVEARFGGVARAEDRLAEFRERCRRLRWGLNTPAPARL